MIYCCTISSFTLVPKKSKDLYKVTALKLGVSEDLVRDAVEIYWMDVRRALTDMKYHAIFIDNLGTFKAKEQRLEEALVEYERLFSFNDGSSFRKMSMKNELESRIGKIKNLLGLIQADKVKKQFIQDKRDGKITSSNLEEPIPNPGGDPKLDIQEGSSGEDLLNKDEDM